MEINEYFGQWSGMNLQCTRLTASAVHELIGLLRKNSCLLEHKEIKQALKKSPNHASKYWNQLTSFAKTHSTETQGEGRILRSLDRIRNHATFHYHLKDKFMNGYSEWRRKEGFASKSAYLSAGASMEQTRFYFADAAMQGALEKVLEEEKISYDDILKYVRHINNSLRYIVTAYSERASERQLQKKARSKPPKIAGVVQE